MDLVPILPTHIIHALDTGHLLCLYCITSSCKTLPTWALSSFFNYLIFVPDLRVSWLLEVFASTPSHLVLPYKLNAVDYMGNPVVDFLRYYDGTGQCNLALRCEYSTAVQHPYAHSRYYRRPPHYQPPYHRCRPFPRASRLPRWI
jgi:hypothetical protein